MGSDSSRLPGMDAEAPEAAAPLRGLARAAAEAPLVDERNDVQYAEIPCRTVLNRCRSERVPFEWTINPYKGCECGCSYCYARYTHEYLELNHWLDFERRIFIKAGAEVVLEREIGRRVAPGEAIAVGTATDPYQPIERREGLTRRLLEKLAARRGLILSVTTKSDLVLRDLDLLAAIASHSRLTVNLTITTLDRRLARVLEPRAPTPARRLEAIRQLAAAGLRVHLFLAPVMPEINDSPEQLELLIGAAAEAGARGMMTQLLFLNSSAARRFMPWLEERFPHLVPLYGRLYGGPSEELALRSSRLGQQVEALRAGYGLAGRQREEEEGLPPLGEQLALPF
jgi:DNA repair photolyase